MLLAASCKLGISSVLLPAAPGKGLTAVFWKGSSLCLVSAASRFCISSLAGEKRAGNLKYSSSLRKIKNKNKKYIFKD